MCACIYIVPWNRVFSEKLTGFAANQEIPRILCNPKVHYRTHKRPPPVPIQSHINPFHSSPFHFLKINFNTIFLSIPRCSKWPLSFRSAHQNPICTSPVFHTCHMPCPPHSSRLGNIWRREHHTILCYTVFPIL